MQYDHLKLEAKWQKYWAEHKTFKAEIDLEKEKVYVLDMFPYPSGAGLHVGHPLGYTATDIYSRFKRLQGFNVLHPMGWDAFGLPAEQYAIKTGTHPKKTTEENIKNFMRQIKMLGFSYDWDREINTTDEKYYKWTQWIFLQLYNKGLAYEAKVPVNWCPELKAVLANEEVIDGKSEIGGHPVIQQPMRQWMLKITDYAESLLNGLNDLDWPESVKDLQRNWIGKSEGANIHFNLPSINQAITIYTTRPDTLFGATYMVLAPEHPLVEKLVSSGQKSAVISYTEASQKKSDMDRGELNKEKTGVPLDAYAINPVNGEEVPIWVADYVLMSYGTGAIMAVPGHDQRDYEFAKEYDLPIVEVVSGGDITENAYTDNIDGLLINSSNDDGLDLNGQKVANAIQSTIEWLKRSEKGEATIQYKLRDWLFSRQRYWGEPIPVVHKADGSIIAINESDLPLTLPQVEKYEPAGTGESPLANIDDWVNAPEGKRETNTMPQWAGSCWYYLRFVDPLNEAQSWSKEAESYWMPVDLYVGGVEHAVLHLLYSRFWHHVLHDLGLVSTREPFQKLFNQGMIQGEDGQKMSKSRGNVVNPDDVVGEFGADSFRLYEMFMGPLEKSKPWSTTGLQGCYRFVQKVWKLFTEDSSRIQENCASDETIKILHQSIKKVTEDLSDLRFNTSVSQLMIFVNHLTKLEKLDKFVLHQFLLILNPFAPHLSEELNQMLGYKIITNSDWPIYDKTKILEDKIEIAIQFNGKTRGKIHIANEESQIGIELSIKNDPKLSKYLYEKTIFKVIYIKNRIINFVLR
ncbi:MAG: leucine--tRNA ligase [Candidatus Marinimicrobia bacterium]|nr:leucine--tRNA ligase [Candidatus Neomarinimicrobiota bacterium]MBT6866593.1 leucine--tRNA ligase [Candidatus Neomarinimicrobiota bacterium]MBT7946116.1 leucine--tRNA ligase [Candidatus Neomarinimicrobiota bacterium]